MLRVLIVEDEEIIRRGLVYAFDWLSMGCVLVGEACDGIEGLEKLESTECDVVITDIKMPRMGGIEMLQTAQALGITGFESVLLTSYAEFDYAQKAIQLQVFEYLLKPIDRDKLRDTMRRLSRKLGARQKRTGEGAVRELHIIDEQDYTPAEGGRSEYVAHALRRICEDYAQRLSVEEIAQECDVSPSYLSRIFRGETSQTFLDMLNRYRVQKAVELMQRGEQKVYEISERTGLGSYKHFYQVFRKYTGLSPTEFMQDADLAPTQQS